MGQEVDAPTIAPSSKMPKIRGPRAGGGRKFPTGTVIVAVLVAAGCGAALYAFAGATVEVTPTTSPAYVSDEFTATAGSGDLPFEVVTAEVTVSKSVPAESSVTANDPAQGTITIYNEQDTAQTLIKNTRFESPEGLIFRIRDSVSIPAGSPGRPGTVTVTVYADVAGESHNIGPSDFTVPGLAGSASFDAVYAKSTAGMTGGFVGVRPSVSDTTREREAATLRSTLQSDLDKAMQEKIPEGYVLIPGASFSSYETLPDAAGANGSVDIKLRGTMSAVIFPNEALAKSVAYATLGNYTGQTIRLSSVEDVSLTSEAGVAPVGAETYTFTLTGDLELTYNVDSTRIAGAVAGKTREGSQMVLTSFPEVDRAVFILRPFWTTTFPNDPSKIKVIITQPS